jgi:bacillithiol biosynthesis cysteine-adding enzyme BshC
MQPIPYDQLPGQPLIFLDVIRSFPKVARFFNGDFRNEESYRKVWQNLQSFPFQRQAVSHILLREQERLNAPTEACENAKLIANPQCAAVLTGQQVGILGGPLYTLIKAVAAIGWAKRLSGILNTPVVPIFWMEGEDHDFEEIRRVNILNRQNQLISVELEDTRSHSHLAVGWHIPSEEMTRFLDVVEDALLPGLHHDEVITRIRSCYGGGASLSDGFGKWLSTWLGEQGLVVIESLNPELKRIAAPYFQKAVERSEIHSNLFRRRKQELEATGYSCTLTPNPDFYFFYILEDGVRTAVSRTESSIARLLELAKNHAEVFSPKAILRPIIQDVLFPTVAIVAGPGEVSYFPQVQPFYQDFEHPMPIIIPRPGVTLLEKSWQRNLDKLPLLVPDLFLPMELLNRKISQQDDSVLTDDVENKLHQASQILDELESQISKDNQALSEITEKFRQDIESRFTQYQQRVQGIIAKRNTEMLDKIQQLRSVIYPNENLQERVLSPLNFLCRHGFNWVAERLYSVPIDIFEHYIVPLEE